jgi:hypothetical protein
MPKAVDRPGLRGKRLADMERQLPEKDWKLLRQLAPVALERFCDRVLREATVIATAPGKTNHERYLELYKLMKEQDRDLASAFNDHRRSTALHKLAWIYSLRLLTEDEFGGFSEETRETALFLASLGS